MNGPDRQPPWYSLGLAFQCTQCGRCCAGPEEGYVWVSDEEIADIAASLGLTEHQMRRQYLRRVARRFTLLERKDNHDCIFLTPNGKGGKGCRIYAIRPRQCRTWPFWPANLSSPQAWATAQLRCPGMNRGPVHHCDEIESNYRATDE